MRTVYPSTLYDRLGGAEAMDLLVTSFYTRVLGDPELAPQFQHVTIDWLHAVQREFFTVATGGPTRRHKLSQSLARQKVDLSRKQLVRMSRHLFDTLIAYGLSADDAKDAVEHIHMGQREASVASK